MSVYGVSMSTDKIFADYVTDQARDAGNVTCRKMFGEYALYCNKKVVALICDNQLFVKQTGGGNSLIGAAELAPPYPGAKPCFLIGDKLDDRDWLSELIRITAGELPEPAIKKKRP